MAAGTAMLIAAGVSAAVQAYGSHKQAKAAQKAADVQVDASNTAAVNTRDSAARALDYVSAARNAAPPTSQFPAYNKLMGGGAFGGPNTSSGPPILNGLKPGMPGAGGQSGLPSGYQALFGPLQSSPQSQVQPGMVMLESPDGKERKAVPEAEAQRWIGMGAKRIG